MECLFCHNPEAQKTQPEIAYSRNLCIECGACLEICPHGALDHQIHERIRRERCDCCGKCSDVCPTDAIRTIGKYYSVESLTDILLRDREYYRHSNGGVTLSGGEPTLFPFYLERLLRALKKEGIHICLETCGYFSLKAFKRSIFPYLDLIYFDIKFIDNQAHLRYCGRPNEIILRNFSELAREEQIEVVPRIPFIPGITTTETNLGMVVDFLRSCGAKKVIHLPYNPLGRAKFQTLGRKSPNIPDRFMTSGEIEHARKILDQAPN